jgi:amino acid transporter
VLSIPITTQPITDQNPGGLGFVIVIVIAACMDPNIENVLGSAYGQPMAQIYFDALGKKGAIGMMCLVFIVQYLMGLSIVVASSRQMWAFSRDGALPFSSFFRPIVSFDARCGRAD